MPPRKRKSKAVKEPTPEPVVEPEIPQSIPEVVAGVVEAAAERMEAVQEAVVDVAHAASEFVETINGAPEASTSSRSTPSMTQEERTAKMEELRKRMHESAQANRAAVIKEDTTHKLTVKDTLRLERQKHLAEVLRAKADKGEEELERTKNWEYTIEENDVWEKRLKRKTGRSDFQFHDEADQARKKYKKDLDLLKPDLIAYNRQKELALGLAPGTLVKTNDAGTDVIVASSEDQKRAAENLYRDANTLLYADNKPSEEAIDRVVQKLNKDIDKRNKFSRKRNEDGEPELITYINEKNRVFNKKIARYYDKYTEEIRASFERGTAL